MEHYFLNVTTQQDGLLQCVKYIGKFQTELEAKNYLMERLTRCKYLPVDKGDEIEFSGFLSPATLHKGYFPMQYPYDAPVNYYFTGIIVGLDEGDTF